MISMILNSGSGNRSFSFFIVLVLLVYSQSTFSYMILIDPGHGGEDTGAKSEWIYRTPKGRIVKTTIYEKDLALIFSEKLSEKLNRKYSVFLTRTFDHSVSLETRAQLAEKIKADLFISIHINSDSKKMIHGTETYYLNNHNDSAVKKVEMIENQKLDKREDIVVNNILIDLVIERTVEKSRRLAHLVHSRVKRNMMLTHQLADRKVRPGLFYVLTLAKRPALLLEVAFISNPGDLKKMLDPTFQENYAEAVAEGIEHFITSEDKKEN